MCCNHITTTPTTIAAATAEDIKDVTEPIEEITKSGDLLQAEPSEIDEVVVKITGEAVEVNIHYNNQ